MSLYVVGDVHGKCEEFRARVKTWTQEGDAVIQCGDMGAGFREVPQYPERVHWIRGNHDDPEASRQHYNYLGDWGYDNGLFWLAGAWSIDWEWRKSWNLLHQPKKVWWEDEELSYQELEKAIELYKETKPDIVISHEAPASVVPMVLSKQPNFRMTPGSPLWTPDYDQQLHRPEKLECIKTRTSQALQTMLDYHRPRIWCFGHYHISKIIDTGSTLFKCCEELEFFRIPEKQQ